MRSITDIAVQSCVTLTFILAVKGMVFDHKRLLFNARPHSDSFDSHDQYKVVEVRLSEYRFENCGDESRENFIVTNLVFSPDPLVFPGEFNVSFQAELKIDVPNNLKAQVQLSKRVGSQDVPLPCVANIGSCVYDDLCSILSGVVCPREFVTAGVPCKCPFKAGTYNLPVATFRVYAVFLLPGVYTFVVNLTHGDTYLGCYKLVATFACKY